MNGIKKWAEKHPDLWEFILFNILSNVATVTNFIVVWICTGVLFKGFKEMPFKFFIFDYSTEASLMLCGFLSFLLATAAAQTVNFFVQKNFVFKSNAAFAFAVPKYILLAVVLVIVSAALPAYSQQFLNNIGVSSGLVPTIANVINILVQVVLSYPAMKFWIMPKQEVAA